jgi:hypothetical protein
MSFFNLFDGRDHILRLPDNILAIAARSSAFALDINKKNLHFAGVKIFLFFSFQAIRPIITGSS